MQKGAADPKLGQKARMGVGRIQSIGWCNADDMVGKMRRTHIPIYDCGGSNTSTKHDEDVFHIEYT